MLELHNERQDLMETPLTAENIASDTFVDFGGHMAADFPVPVGTAYVQWGGFPLAFVRPVDMPDILLAMELNPGDVFTELVSASVHMVR
jgi:hypothetical protein